MFKKIVLPLMLLAAGGFVVVLAVSSVPSSIDIYEDDKLPPRPKTPWS